MTRLTRLRAAVATVLVAAFALPAAAQASPEQFSIMMDDDALLYRGDDARDKALRQMKLLDVDAVRVTVLWSVVANEARDTKALDRRFRKLGADNPKAYPKLNWDRYDRLVKAAKRLGIRIYFNITGPGPAWGHAKAPKSQSANKKTWKPKAREFYKFVQAVGKRYSGGYRDENDEKGSDGKRLALPRVDFWSLWNEPNQAGWLTPQWENGRPASPHIFRQLHDFGYRALQSTGHGGDTILLGETAPLGSNKKSVRAPMAPKVFLRELFCVDGAMQPLQGAEATARKCTGFPLKATAYAHHPYTKKLGPTAKDPNPDAITMANFGDLGTMLDQIAATTGRVAPGMKLMSTEFGYETNPPDPHNGVDLATQADWIQIGEYLAFRDPRVLAQSQFLLYDVKPRKQFQKGSKAYWFTYQSGLLGSTGTPKPALTAYTMPFLAITTGQLDPASGRPLINLWGSLRFRPDGLPAGTDSVMIQWRPPGGGWVDFGAIAISNIKNFYELPVVSPGPGFMRAVWNGAQAPFTSASREQPVP